jgi:hypothetical protein
MPTSTNYQLPPFYTQGDNVSTWLLDIFNEPYGLPCICGDQTIGSDVYAVRPAIVKICQDEDTPCLVHIDFHLGTAVGSYYLQPDQSGFSIDTTNGANGFWNKLNPETFIAYDGTWTYGSYNPAAHGSSCNPSYAQLGIPVHRISFDMCEHISTWFTENKVSFRLTFDDALETNSFSLIC